MNNVIEFFKDNTNRYSFHFLAWIIYFCIALLKLVYLYQLPLVEKNPEYGDALAWYFIFCYLVFYPFIFGLITLIYLRLRIKERKQSGFRIKNKFITQNLFFRIVTILSAIISILFFVVLLYLPIYGLISEPNDIRLVTIEPFDKITRIILVLYLLAFFIK